MREFEYKVAAFQVFIKYQEIDIKELNALGSAGWELVTIINGDCIFKREMC